MDTLYVIARLAGERVALRAAAVESVIEIDAITPVPAASPHVAGLAALRSRVLTVIDSRRALGLDPADVAPRPTALVCTCDGHSYGLLVEAVEDVVDLARETVKPAETPLAPCWARVTAGLVLVDGDTTLVVDPAALIRGPDLH